MNINVNEYEYSMLLVNIYYIQILTYKPKSPVNPIQMRDISFIMRACDERLSPCM